MCRSILFLTITLLSSLFSTEVSGRILSDASDKKLQVRDTAISLSEVAVVAQLKQKNDLRLEPLSSSVLKMGNIERRQISSLNDFSYYTPNVQLSPYPVQPCFP